MEVGSPNNPVMEHRHEPYSLNRSGVLGNVRHRCRHVRTMPTYKRAMRSLTNRKEVDSMTLATTKMSSEETLRLESLLGEGGEELCVPPSWTEEVGGSLYETPEASADDVEEVQERVVWFFPPVWLLLILGVTLLAGAYVYCLRKGMRFYAMARLDERTVKVGCKK